MRGCPPQLEEGCLCSHRLVGRSNKGSSVEDSTTMVVRIEWNDMAQSRSRSLILLPWVGYAARSNSTFYSVKMQATTLYNYATVSHY